MDSLAPELLDAIVDDLDSADLARFMASSRSFGDHVERVLYATPERCSIALRWACSNGNHELVRRAISYGSSVSVIHPSSSQSVPVLTLFLAAKHKQVDTFSFLLDLGATISVPEDGPTLGLRSQVTGIMKWLSLPANLHLLQVFLDKGLDSQVKALHCPAIAWPLTRAIQSGASLALVYTLLDHGADPNMVLSHAGHPIASPLSAAILAGSHEIVRALTTKGASIHGHPRIPGLPGKYHTHLPMFAAVAHLASARQGGEDMLKLCLELGGDINQRDYLIIHRPFLKYHWITPLLTFLDMIHSWTEIKGDPSMPHERLAVLLDHGASAPSRGENPSDHRTPPGVRWPLDFPSTVEVLIEARGIDELAQNSFATAVELLIQRGTMSTYDINRVLDICCREYDIKPSLVRVVLARWCKLLDLIMARAKAPDYSTTLLTTLINNVGKSHHLKSKAKHLLLATMEYLLKVHGADINAPVFEGQETIEQVTAMHALCLHYVSVATSYQAWNSHYLGFPGLVNGKSELFPILLQKGADPNIAFGGKTAMDVLTKGLETASSWGEPSLRIFIAALENTEKV